MLSPRIRMSRLVSDCGPEFSRIVLGWWRLASWDMSPQQRLAFLQQGLELGITTMDHADIYGDYGCEALFGETLALQPSLRAGMELVSKCGIKLVSRHRPKHASHIYDTTRAHIIASAENSLRNLRTDYLDLLLIHRPDPLMDADEVAEAFAHLRASGKVRHFGVSNFTPAQFELLHSRFPLVTNQVELSLLQMGALHDGSLDQCQRLRLAPMIWSALGGGSLFTSDEPRVLRIRHALENVAAETGKAPAAVATAWVLQHPSRPVVLTGSGRIAALRDAVAAASLELTRDQWFALWTASAGHEIP